MHFETAAKGPTGRAQTTPANSAVEPQASQAPLLPMCATHSSWLANQTSVIHRAAQHALQSQPDGVSPCIRIRRWDELPIGCVPSLSSVCWQRLTGPEGGLPTG